MSCGARERMMADKRIRLHRNGGMDWVRLAEPLRQNPAPIPCSPRPQHRPQPRRTGHDRGSVVRGAVHRRGQASSRTLEVAAAAARGHHRDRRDESPIRRFSPDGDAPRARHGAPAPHRRSRAPTARAFSPARRAASHVLAVFYEIARRVDEDPRVALELQGYFQAAQEDSAAPVSTGWVRSTRSTRRTISGLPSPHRVDRVAPKPRPTTSPAEMSQSRQCRRPTGASVYRDDARRHCIGCVRHSQHHPQRNATVRKRSVVTWHQAVLFPAQRGDSLDQLICRRQCRWRAAASRRSSPWMTAVRFVGCGGGAWRPAVQLAT